MDPVQRSWYRLLPWVTAFAVAMGFLESAVVVYLLAKGLLTPLIFRCDDVDALFEHVQASGRAEVLQEPADQFYGVRDCAFRDPAGNMLRFNAALPAKG